tara:strand:- start:77 stop:235 length:159 start_codon:yes stop_codon:yes gene_type:complete
MTFSMIQFHKWSLSEIENMLPWEREIYVNKLQEHIQEENKRIEEQNRRNKHG